MTVPLSLARSKGMRTVLRRVRTSIDESIFWIVQGPLKWENTPESTLVVGLAIIDPPCLRRGRKKAIGVRANAAGRQGRSVVGVRREVRSIGATG